LFLHPNGFDLGIEESEAWAETVIARIEHRLAEDDSFEPFRPLSSNG